MKQNQSTISKEAGIELRSERVRRITGHIPRRLTLWGYVILIVVTLTLLLVLFTVPYPYGHGEALIRHLW